MSGPEHQPTEEIILQTPEGLVARVNELGALVESLTTLNGQKLLFPAQMISGKLRGGIPVCAPVFGPGDTVNLPQHGFFRDLRWAKERPDDASVRLTLDNPGQKDPKLSVSDYADIHAILDIKAISEPGMHGLSMDMTIGNEGDEGVIVTPGFHPYFPVGPIPEGGFEMYHNNEIFKFNPSELGEAKTLSKNEAGEIWFKNGISKITIRTENLPVPVLWTADPDLYLCVEPTKAGAATASAATLIEEDEVIYPGEVQKYSMQISWWG